MDEHVVLPGKWLEKGFHAIAIAEGMGQIHDLAHFMSNSADQMSDIKAWPEAVWGWQHGPAE